MFNGNTRRDWYVIAPAVKKHREWARLAALEANVGLIPNTGDIRVIATFYPPHRRGDRVSYPSLLKPYWDGVADALMVNDARFLPSYVFAEPSKPGAVVLSIAGVR
jgi:hypothetical protein